MVERVLLQNRLVVVDDVLTADRMQSASELASGASFDRAGLGSRIWARNKLNPEIGPWFIWPNEPKPTADQVPDGTSSGRLATGRKGIHESFLHYPTATVLDHILEVARSVAQTHNLITAAPTDDPYAGIMASLYSYRAGSRLVWHTDGEYVAAFAAFLSPNWSENGGGYFAYQPDDTNRRLGTATIIEPRRNRLVVFAGGLRHSVLAIAKDVPHPRISFSGFFIKRSHLARFKTLSLLRDAGQHSLDVPSVGR